MHFSYNIVFFNLASYTYQTMARAFTEHDKSESSEEFLLIHEIADALSSSLNLKDTLSRIFEMLDEKLALKKSILTLYDTYSDSYSIELAYGVSQQEFNSSLFQNWESYCKYIVSQDAAAFITQDIETPIIFGEHTPELLTEYEYIGLPIILNNEVIGVLSINCSITSAPKLYKHVRLFFIIALMVAQEIKLKRMLEVEKEELRNENVKLKDELKDKYNITNMIGKSSAMLQVYEGIKQVEQSNASVLIWGESGTGKELVAHAIHYNSPRANDPFIKLNCGAIPESLIESELFGYEKGAFTDAQEQRIGKFEAANGGTIFLDEIGELSPAVQVKLLRVLQDKEFTRVGGVSPVKINVRVIAATNRNLEEEMKKGNFRQDLYYRLNVFPIYIQPLRDRRTDIMLLVEHFLNKFSKENDKSIQRISPLAADLLTAHSWPGNVRELENCIERAVIICNGTTLQGTHLPPALQRADTGNFEQAENLSLDDLVKNFEREIIIDALSKSRGKQSKAAQLLKTTQRILGYKIKHLDIDIKQLKEEIRNSKD